MLYLVWIKVEKVIPPWQTRLDLSILFPVCILLFSFAPIFVPYL